MNQPTRHSPGNPWRLRAVADAGPAIPAVMVGAAAAGSTAAHLAAAMTGPGAMAWLMAVMGAACLACAVPMAAGRWCAGRAAGHLLAMSAAMILVHLTLLLGPAAGNHTLESHHDFVGAGAAGSPGASTAASTGHDSAMLALIAVELLCLMAASAALRLSRGKPPGTLAAAARAAVVR
ncbi:hypothetical protein AB0N65_01065 [Paenarthrobacter sp. NPDC089322]|uniref:hypothetical protein n=1 Tax=Paenarthrobacter sp. NPDC089322 TaxID=3155065 RepID=UPI003419D253